MICCKNIYNNSNNIYIYSCYKLGTVVAFKRLPCIERLLGIKNSNSFHMDWSLIKFVPSHPFLDRFAPFLNLCWLCAPSPTPTQTLVDWPPKLNWPVNEECLDSLLSDRVQCIAELLTCSDSWLALPNTNGLQFGPCHCVLAFVWLHERGSGGTG